jgi:thioredoxin reductase (NADPH)
MDYDLIVIGGGLAGLTAGLYGARYGLKTLVIERMMPGGQVVNIEKIETFPGFPDGIGGAELGPTVHMQAEQAGAECIFDEVTGIERGFSGFTVGCASGERKAKAVIIAAGSSRRALSVPGEEENRGRGVSECAACDGSFFIGKKVMVVGGGDSALEEACVLADQGVAEVRIVHRGAGYDAQQAIQQRLAERPAIAPLFGTELVEIRGEGGVSEVVLRQGEAERTEAADGVFPYIGLKPNTDWLRGTVDLDDSGHVVTDAALMTSVPGIFAAGDIRQNSVAQLVASAGDGASAAVAAARYLAGRR